MMTPRASLTAHLTSSHIAPGTLCGDFLAGGPWATGSEGQFPLPHRGWIVQADPDAMRDAIMPTHA